VLGLKERVTYSFISQTEAALFGGGDEAVTDWRSG